MAENHFVIFQTTMLNILHNLILIGQNIYIYKKDMDNFHDKQINLVLNKRKGFIKLALRNGTSLVPTFVFGETHLYKQSGLVSRLQDSVVTNNK